jgi:DNA-binding NarL/FixJ family response regulator
MEHETHQFRASASLRPPPVEVVTQDTPALAPSNPGHIVRIRVLCVHDSPDSARMLAGLLWYEEDLKSVGVLLSAAGLVKEVQSRRADVVVLDLTIPGCDTLAAIRDVAERVPRCRVIAYSGHDDPDTCDEVRRAGGWGLVSKGREMSAILAAIRRAAESGRSDRM